MLCFAEELLPERCRGWLHELKQVNSSTLDKLRQFPLLQQCVACIDACVRGMCFTNNCKTRAWNEFLSASGLSRRGRVHAYFGPSCGCSLAAVKHLVSVIMLEWMKIFKAVKERHFRDPFFPSSDKQVSYWNRITAEYDSFVLVLRSWISKKTRLLSEHQVLWTQCQLFFMLRVSVFYLSSCLFYLDLLFGGLNVSLS